MILFTIISILFYGTKKQIMEGIFLFKWNPSILYKFAYIALTILFLKMIKFHFSKFHISIVLFFLKKNLYM